MTPVVIYREAALALVKTTPVIHALLAPAEPSEELDTWLRQGDQFVAFVVPESRQKLLKTYEEIAADLRAKLFLLPANHATGSVRLLSAGELVSVLEKVLRSTGHQVRGFPGLDRYDKRTPDTLELFPQPTQVIRGAPKKPDVSIIIPTYNNIDTLPTVLEQLSRLSPATGLSLEVLVVNDGSTDETSGYLREAATQTATFSLTVVHLARTAPRQMGDAQYRAGIARNVGADLASGNVICFLDADMLVPPEAFQDLIAASAKHDIVMAQRLFLKQDWQGLGAPLDGYYENAYWEEFFRSSTAWNERPDRWKFTCTYALVMKRSTFFAIGGFRRCYTFYGFEDTDLGYRAHIRGLRFFLCPSAVYHLPQPVARQEGRGSAIRRRLLLEVSARIFYLNYLDPEIPLAIGNFLRDPISPLRWWRQR